ncbi:AbiA family abortive infection protein [Lactobacillus delbrueckii subsp. allosunkii]|uniref:AbiA family abortive infection protein n=1 Tax=Lactobacillus delbrueckii TaxID=1584 RepID=UPI003A84546F
MFGISYDVWKSICEMYFSLSSRTCESYLQWYPFTNLSNIDKEEIKSREFFDKYIDLGGFVLFPEMMHHSENFIQKADGSFRNATLISPILFLVLQAMGKEISNRYIVERPSDVEAFYAGNYGKSRAKYKSDYDRFYKIVNTYADECQYFIKTDIKSFYQNINVNKLVKRIDYGCNKKGQKVSQLNLLLLKELLLYCGDGDYPLVENSMASSYLSTVIYLDEIDTRLYKFIKEKVNGIFDLHMVRYVDDLYILFSSPMNENQLNRAYNDILRNYSSILKEYGLALNTSKCLYKSSMSVNDELKRSLYDEYVNGVKHELGELFKGKMNSFLKGVYSTLDKGITYKDYIELIDSNFSSNDIELTPMAVYNYFIYENQTELIKKENIEELSKILEKDNSFLALDTKRLTIMVMRSRNGQLIKEMLSHLFNRHRIGLWNSFDTSIAVNYLIQRNFMHGDLIATIQKEIPKLYSYYECFCKKSFLLQLKKERKWRRYIIGVGKDKIALILYFMYLCEQNRYNHFADYVYYKSFFDRMSADMAYCSGLDKKPNYNRYYEKKRLKELYSKNENSACIIKRAHELRNHDPLAHASAELINNNDSSEKLKKIEKDLDSLIDDYSQRHCNEWLESTN